MTDFSLNELVSVTVVAEQYERHRTYVYKGSKGLKRFQMTMENIFNQDVVVFDDDTDDTPVLYPRIERKETDRSERGDRAPPVKTAAPSTGYASVGLEYENTLGRLMYRQSCRRVEICFVGKVCR